MHTVWKMEKKSKEIKNKLSTLPPSMESQTCLSLGKKAYLLARKGKNEPDSLNSGKKNKEQA